MMFCYRFRQPSKQRHASERAENACKIYHPPEQKNFLHQRHEHFDGCVWPSGVKLTELRFQQVIHQCVGETQNYNNIYD